MDTDERMYRFGPFRVDTRRCALYRGTTPIPLSRKPFDALRVLIEHRGEMVSKEQLIELLWPDRIVEEANLTQTIFMLRKALEDHPEAPRFIQTVPRRGYRFIAPVEESTYDKKISAGEGKASGSRGAKVAVAFVLLALAFALTLWLTPWGRDMFRGQAQQGQQGPLGRIRLAVLPFTATGSDSELRLLAVSMNDLLVSRLGAQPDVLLIRPPAGLESDSTPAALGAFARKGRLTYLFAGNLRLGANPHEARLTITRYDIDQSGSLHKIPLQSYGIPSLDNKSVMGRFVTIRNRIVNDLLQQFGPKVGASSRRQMSNATTPHNAEAYRLYLLALHDLRSATCSGPRAVARLRSSLELDPGFAPAWDALGWAQYNLVSFCGQPESNYTEALRSADRALALAPGLARSIALKAVILVETGKDEAAYALLLKARRDSPWSPDVAFMTAYVLRYAGFLGRASKSLDTLLARDPVYLDVEGWTPNTFLYQGRLDAFLDWLPEGNSPVFLYYRGFTQLLRGKPQAAKRALQPAFRRDPNDVFARLSEALLRILAGDKSTAWMYLHELAMDRSRLGLSDGEMTYKIAQLFVLADYPKYAFDQLNLAVDQGFFNLPYLRSDPVFDKMRGNPRFEAIVKKAQARHDAFSKRFGFAPPKQETSTANAGS